MEFARGPIWILIRIPIFQHLSFFFGRLRLSGVGAGVLLMMAGRKARHHGVGIGAYSTCAGWGGRLFRVRPRVIQSVRLAVVVGIASASHRLSKLGGSFFPGPCRRPAGSGLRGVSLIPI